ncbi:hypothetical protein QTP70_013612 [Hemibagrus guttatus]|uniref:Uncharacterized protein n=1 Tax=Hemibagrus guttatus TaxID=175788 RepID=A0AAE0V3V7_9TELE|nr:hypothetical protein QTP70_013612 [Hemibagrus guttatus]
MRLLLDWKENLRPHWPFVDKIGHPWSIKKLYSSKWFKSIEDQVDFSRQDRKYTSITIDRMPVEWVSIFSVFTSKDLTWSTHTNAVLQTTHQWFFFLSLYILRSFYIFPMESILTGYITIWYGDSTTINYKALQRVFLPGHLHQAVCEESTEPRSETSASRAMDFSRCSPQADGIAASDPAPAGCRIASSCMPSNC